MYQIAAGCINDNVPWQLLHDRRRPLLPRPHVLPEALLGQNLAFEISNQLNRHFCLGKITLSYLPVDVGQLSPEDDPLDPADHPPAGEGRPVRLGEEAALGDGPLLVLNYYLFFVHKKMGNDTYFVSLNYQVDLDVRVLLLWQSEYPPRVVVQPRGHVLQGQPPLAHGGQQQGEHGLLEGIFDNVVLCSAVSRKNAAQGEGEKITCHTCKAFENQRLSLRKKIYRLFKKKIPKKCYK